MKLTIDLPEDLVRQLKLRAIDDGRRLKDIAAEFLTSGLESAPRARPKRKAAIFSKDKLTGISVIVGPRIKRRGKSMMPEEMSQILIDQEAGWAIEVGRFGIPDLRRRRLR